MDEHTILVHWLTTIWLLSMGIIVLCCSIDHLRSYRSPREIKDTVVGFGGLALGIAMVGTSIIFLGIVV